MTTITCNGTHDPMGTEQLLNFGTQIRRYHLHSLFQLDLWGALCFITTITEILAS